MKLTVISETLSDVRESIDGADGCKAATECNSPSQLFEKTWDYFVIKKDEATGKLSSFIECCGKLTGITE